MIIVPEKSGIQNSAYRHRNEGRSRKRGRPSTFHANERRRSTGWRELLANRLLYGSLRHREIAPSMRHSDKNRDWRIPAAWVTLCIVWSSTWLVIKIGLRDLPPLSFVAIRFLIALLVLIAISVGRTRLLPKSQPRLLRARLHRAPDVSVSITRFYSGPSCMFPPGWRR